MPVKKIPIEQYLAALRGPLKQCTLYFALDGPKVLLGRRKQGSGQGKWVGIGGRVEAGEGIETATVRECIEEVGLSPLALQKVALLTFLFPYAADPQNWNQEVHVYKSSTWSGQLQESDEIEPAWFAIDQIPYPHMWPDARHWLPAILSGKTLKGQFIYDRDLQIYQYQVHCGPL